MLQANFFGQFRPSSQSIVVFEGGLGNQLLGLFRLQYLLRIGLKPRVDLKYFTSHGDENNLRVVLREWMLEGLGFSIEGLLQEYRQPLKFLGRLSLLRAPNFSDFLQELKEFNWLHRDFVNSLGLSFPPPSLLKKQIGLKDGVNYSCIHVRKGDYLDVGTKILNLDYYERCLNFLRMDSNEKVLVFSDSALGEEFKAGLVSKFVDKNIENFEFFDGFEVDPVSLHSLFSASSALICGNSTFSITAGLMARRESTVVFPSKMYTNLPHDASYFYSAASEFSIL